VRVLYSHYLANDDHPAAAMAHAIADELTRLGHEVRIHRSRGPALPSVKAATPSRRTILRRLKGLGWFARELSRSYPMARRDRATLAEFKPHVVLGRQDAYCWSMAYACRKESIPLVTYADAPVAYETRHFNSEGRWHPPGLVEAVERYVLQQSAAIITVSNPAARRLAHYQLRAPVHVVPNGVHADRFPQFDDAERVQRRRAIGLTAPMIVGFQGTYQPFHGLDRLRDLMLATANEPGIAWMMLGDGAGRAELESVVTGRVPAVFLGRRPAAEVGSLLALMDVAVVPHAHVLHDFYFCPLKILECAAAGCAVIASDQGDIPLLLDEGRAGVILGNASMETWADAVRSLVRDPDRCRALGARARAFVLGKLTWSHTAAAVETVLRSVVPEPGPVTLTATEPSVV
jgi:glycosyltransferase involved in cell wall biosynthesis